MNIWRSIRFASFAALLALMVAAPLLPGSARAADPRGSIHLHARTCPTSIPAGSNIFDLCHGNPGPDGTSFKIDHRQSKDADSSGNVSFGSVTAGDHLVTLTSDWQPNEFLGMLVYCSNLATGTGPNMATVLRGDQAQFWVRVAPGSQLVCDVYFLPESGR
jgi:hypothetical protein